MPNNGIVHSKSAMLWWAKMGYFDWPVRWLSPSDFPSYDIQDMASIQVQNISKQQFYCLSVITYLECIKMTLKNFQKFGFDISPVQSALVTIIATLRWASCGPGTGLQTHPLKSQYRFASSQEISIYDRILPWITRKLRIWWLKHISYQSLPILCPLKMLVSRKSFYLNEVSNLNPPGCHLDC